MYYHVAESKNVPIILTDGLLPQIGPRALLCGEPVAAIYLFPSKDEMEQAMLTWLGDCFDDSVDLTVLEVVDPIEAPLTLEQQGWESICYEPIPPERIRICQEIPATDTPPMEEPAGEPALGKTQT